MLIVHKETAYIHHTQDPEQDPEFNQQDCKIEINYHYGRYYLERLKLEKAYPIGLDENKREVL